MVPVVKQSSVDSAGVGIRSSLDNHHDLFCNLHGVRLSNHSQQETADCAFQHSVGFKRTLEPGVFLFSSGGGRFGCHYGIDNSRGSIFISLRSRNEIEILTDTTVFFVVIDCYLT